MLLTTQDPGNPHAGFEERGRGNKAKAFYVGITRARAEAELVTGNSRALKERPETVISALLAALEGIDESVRPDLEREHGTEGKASLD